MMKEEKDRNHSKFEEMRINSILTILAAIIFSIAAVILPVIGSLDAFSDIFYFLRFPIGSRGIRYVWNGVFQATIFRPYDQWAGLTALPETGYTIVPPYQWVIIGMFLWMLPFVILGIGGAILFALPAILNLMSKDSPKIKIAKLDLQSIGILISLIGVGVEWLFHAIYWFYRMTEGPNLGGPAIVGLLIGVASLYFGKVIWSNKKLWLREFKGSFTNSVFYMSVIFIIIYCIFPFFWALNLSLQEAAYLGGRVEYLPSHPTVVNYNQVFDIFTIPFTQNIWNSLVLASITTVLCVAIGAFGGYVIARFQFSIKRVILALILSMTMFPGIVILVPLYLEYVYVKDTFGLQLINSLPGILIPYITFNLPLTLFLLQNFFKEIPKELIQAARVDGASNFQVFRKVILPLAIPGVFTTGILVFIAVWNEFLFASLLLSQENWTIPVVMASFEGIGQAQGYVAELLLSSATVIVTLPLIILVLIFQKQIISGITAGAVKG